MSNFNIEFDYRFDTNGFFNDPARRQALEAAANMWEIYIQDDFPNIAPGVNITTENPSTGEIINFYSDAEVDDLVIFAGARELGLELLGSGSYYFSYQSNSPIAVRDMGNFFEPWTGTVTFNSSTNWFFDPTPNTTNDIPTGTVDFLSVAVHEIGHILGLTNGNESLTSTGFFTGARATALNGGNPIPLVADLGHVQQGFQIGGVESLMEPTLNGTSRPTPLDLAMLADIGYAVATEGNDQIDGKYYADNINGLGGNDTIFGNSANDTVFGGDGDDLINGNLNNDILFGNAGNDTIYGGQNDDAIYGGKNDDILFGNLGNDMLFGNLGNDTIYGGKDDDIIYGGQENDFLSGDLGNDILSGDRGNDILIGGAGRDTYVFSAESGADVVDFSVADDIIQVGVGLGFNSGADLLNAITSTGTWVDGRQFSLLTLSAGNTITIVQDGVLTAANFAIAG